MKESVSSIDDLKRITDVPVVIVDSREVITYVNESFESVFGWQSNEIIGKLLLTLIPKAFYDAHNLAFSRFLITGQSTVLQQPLRLLAMSKDGHEFIAEHFIIAERNQDKWIFGATIRPLSE